MNAPYFNTFTDGLAQPGHNSADDGGAGDQMEQIQDLLLGDHKREMDRRLAEIEARLTARLAALEAKLDAVVADLRGERGAGETAVLHRLQVLDTQIGAVAGAIEVGHRATFQALSQGVSNLDGRAAKP